MVASRSIRRVLHLRRFLIIAAAGVSLGLIGDLLVYDDGGSNPRILETGRNDYLVAEWIGHGRRPSAPIRVALFEADGRGDGSVSNCREILDSQGICVSAAVTPTEIRSGRLRQFDVIVVGGGGGKQHADALGEEGREVLRAFVASGGGYVGICAGAFLASSTYDWSLCLVNAKTLTGDVYVPGLGVRPMAGRHGGTVSIELTQAGKRLLSGLPERMNVHYSGGPILSPAESNALPEYVSLAMYRTETPCYDPQRGTMVNTPAVIAAPFGKGRVILISPHPEGPLGPRSMITKAVELVSLDPGSEGRRLAAE